MKNGSYQFETKEMRIPRGANQIFATLYLPQTDEKCPAVIMSHGYGGSGRDFTMEGSYFASHGYVALAFDFCGGTPTSRSSGKTSEMSVLTEKEDLLALLAYVKSLDCVDSSNIFLLGKSQGGFVSALASAECPKDVRAIVLYYPAFCIPDDWIRRYPDPKDIPETENFWGIELGSCYCLAVHGMDPYETVRHFDKEVLIFHGDQDPVVALSYSVRLKETYPHAELIVYEGEGHGFTPAKDAESAEKALEFMRKNRI